MPYFLKENSSIKYHFLQSLGTVAFRNEVQVVRDNPDEFEFDDSEDRYKKAIMNVKQAEKNKKHKKHLK